MFEGLVTIPAVKRKKKTERFYKKRNKRFLENAAKKEKRLHEKLVEHLNENSMYTRGVINARNDFSYRSNY